MMQVFRKILEVLIYLLNSLSIFVIVWGTILQFCNFLKIEFSKPIIKDKTESMGHIVKAKNFLGIYILFGLELLICADILETILNPTIERLAVLSVIVFIRTIISFFLSREISFNLD